MSTLIPSPGFQLVSNTLKYKREAFCTGDILALSNINKSLRPEISLAKRKYKKKIELEFATMNTKQAFQSLKRMAGRSDATCASPPEPLSFVSELNKFYCRFDTSDFSLECE